MSPTTERRPGPLAGLSSSVALGLLLIGLGVLLLLDRTDVLDAGALAADWWPLLIVAVGSWMVLTSSRLAGALAIAVGLLALGAIHEVVEADLVGLIWPAILIAIGGGAVTAGARIRGATRGRSSTTPVGPRAALPTATAVFGDARVTVSDDGSERMAVTAISVFGDVVASVPAGWRVVDRTTTLLGDITIPGSQPSYAEAPVVEVHGLALFGDIRVRYLDEVGSL
jgi:hypothetical protein